MNIAELPLASMRQDTQIALGAGQVMVQGFRAPNLPSERKPDGTRVIPGIDERISESVAGFYMAFGERVASEETGGTAEYGDPNAIYIDPTDGTLDLLWGRERDPQHSLAMFSMARVVQGRPRTGVAYAPLLLEPRLYQAAEGEGAYRITANGVKRLYNDPSIRLEDSAVLVAEGDLRRRAYLEDRGVTAIPVHGAVFRACAVADPELLSVHDPTLLPEGKQVAGFISPNTWPHDYLAAAVIGWGAGLFVTGMDGGSLRLNARKNGCIFARNDEVHRLLVDSSQSA